jgi:hypothetical protein
MNIPVNTFFHHYYIQEFFLATRNASIPLVWFYWLKFYFQLIILYVYRLVLLLCMGYEVHWFDYSYVDFNWLKFYLQLILYVYHLVLLLCNGLCSSLIWLFICRSSISWIMISHRIATLISHLMQRDI